ncbi:hypothetical protein DFJ58DRAFT_652246 [Suillus subalutaceus]|uniref:uncharacterized protein n=1 Tax=Suillus subalutaceus TaxID=48586 RepID=UPI001B869315|nr:uncharacterized protein DFJ58DRAFT_652246 [Suillus subalutaceus]KAG1872300.1 hypothetical protein DFJ58DRAFT_652246 [Suillus subalutaceus]
MLPKLHIYFENHTSSQLNSSFIDFYIISEQAAGHYSQGFDPHELKQIIGPFLSSPLSLVPKPHSNKFCLVQDLSYLSINTSIISDNASVTI